MQLFSITNVDNICPPPSTPMVDFNIDFNGDNLRAEQSLPIDTMLKTHIQAINIL